MTRPLQVRLQSVYREQIAEYDRIKRIMARTHAEYLRAPVSVEGRAARMRLHALAERENYRLIAVGAFITNLWTEFPEELTGEKDPDKVFFQPR